MVDSVPYGTIPMAADGASGDRTQPAAVPIETGAIAHILAAPGTSDFVRKWLGAALGRDPLLAYQEAATLAGMLELLSCDEARAWLAPALVAALQGDAEAAFGDALDIARALKPAAMVLQRLAQRPPAPANCDMASSQFRPRGEE